MLREGFLHLAYVYVKGQYNYNYNNGKSVKYSAFNVDHNFASDSGPCQGCERCICVHQVVRGGVGTRQQLSFGRAGLLDPLDITTKIYMQ